MRKVHFVQMKLGQTSVGMIHKFVPLEVKDQNFLKFSEESDEATAKARELKRTFAKR